ncbi:MAG: alpha/beta hydrolase [Bacteroidales bacterium]|nr:alpha/beta hydrolase [Bacteroidales bacterium]
MAKIQFSHANGFPAESYNCFLKHLDAEQVNFVSAFGLNDYKITSNWKPLINELIESIESSFNEPIVGLGHSLGGIITYLAAQKRPDLFSQIIVLDPPFFRPLKRFIIELMVQTKTLKKFPHPANKTKFRRTKFKSGDEAFDYFKNKALFKETKDECLGNYVTAGLKEEENGMVLEIPRDLEYLIFITMPLYIPTRKLKFPASFVYSNEFQTMEKRDVNWVQRRMSFFDFIEMDGSHLFPFEKPKETADLINSLIKN